MACTTILVGKAASYDGSTMIARNDDSGSGHFTAKKFTVIHPEDLPKTYRSVLSHVEIPLPEGALRFTAMPNAVEGKGIWAASGVNAANVGMTATETITSNPRVLGADPLVEYQPAKGEKPEVPGGIGEEDIVYLVLHALPPAPAGRGGAGGKALHLPAGRPHLPCRGRGGRLQLCRPPHRGRPAHLRRHGHLFHLQEQHLQRDAPAGYLGAA